MTSIAQKIPRYIFGMSDQPDELKVPGQVRDAENVLPDVTLGLLKRPGTKYISDLTTTATGKWFHIHKNAAPVGSERFLGQITQQGQVFIWDLYTGLAQNVTYSDVAVSPDSLDDYDPTDNTDTLQDYFIHEEHNQLDVLTVNDYTFVTNKTATPSMSEEVISVRPYEAFIELRAVATQQNYRLDFSSLASDSSGNLTKTSTITGLSVSFDGWNGYIHSDNEDSCARAGTFVEEDDDFGSGTGASWYSQVSCQAITPKDPAAADAETASKYTVAVTLTEGGTGYEVGDTVIKTNYGGIEGNNYKFTVTSVAYTTTKSNIGTATYTASALNAVTIINNLVGDINNDVTGCTAERIGNGIYVTSSDPFIVTTPDPTLLVVVSATDDGDYTTTDGAGGTTSKTNIVSGVNDVSQLPYQCKDGYIVRIRNSFELEDDYYVKFIGNFGQDGDGVWEECAKPGIKNLINADSMPHAIMQLADTVDDGSGNQVAQFLVAPLEWSSRRAGDEVTNARPHFLPRPGNTFGRPIQSMLFYRDRLVFLSDEYIIMSSTGDYFNVFAKSALTLASDDPINVAVSSTIPAILHSGIVLGAGLLIVSPNQQFLVRTDNDLLSPLTVKVSNISGYSINANTKPLSLGTNVGFFSDSGLYTRFYEMVEITVDRDPEVIEQSKAAGTLLPQNLELITDSTENDLILAVERDSNVVWCYKYFNTGEKRVLNSWFYWTMMGNVMHHALIKDSYYAALEDSEGTVRLVRADIRPLRNTTVFTDNDFRIHFDYYGSLEEADMTYNETDNVTTFTLPIPYFEGEELQAFSMGDEPGRIGDITVDGNTGSLQGDWTDDPLALGYTFAMRIEFPVIYPTKKSGLSGALQADTRGYLTLNRIKFTLGDQGYYEAILKSFGRADRTIIIENAIAGRYKANTAAISDIGYKTIPVYDKNLNFNLELYSKHPSPTTLYSMEWEGNYTPMYYQSV
jgi:hypothetical protein